MPNLPAVCPLCAHVHQLDPNALPERLTCAGCGAPLSPKAHGAAVLLEASKAERREPPEKPEVEALLAQAEQERKPDIRYKLLQQALALDPESFAANKALLYHGKLHEVVRRPGEYSLIKCYLMHMYEDPRAYTGAQLDTLVEELFRSPLLLHTRTLSGDPKSFEKEYLTHLAREYMRIFLRGRSGIERGMFGFPRSAETVYALCEGIVNRMCAHVAEDSRLTPPQKEELTNALQHALKLEM